MDHIDKEVFKKENKFFCSICGERIVTKDEIEDELCRLCLNSITQDEEFEVKKKILE